MNAVTLFSYITQEEQERMKVCFGMREACYENNETIMEYAHSMKKIGLLFLTALLSLTLPACNDDDGDYPYVYGLITTVHTLGDKEYYFERDNGQTLFQLEDGTVTAERPQKRTAVSLANFRRMLEPTYLKLLLRSLKIALFTTIICLLLGYPVALILSSRDFKRPGLWLMLIILPMWMNFLLRTYSWMSILENSGILNSWIASLRDAIPAFDRWLTSMGVGKKIIFLYNEKAVVLGMVYNYLSFMIMPIYTVIEKTDHSLLEAAADLGASPVQSFLRVTLPYSLPGVLEGITMVFVPAVTTFVISQLMGGGKVPLIGDIIQNQFGKSSDWRSWAAFSALTRKKSRGRRCASSDEKAQKSVYRADYGVSVCADRSADSIFLQRQQIPRELGRLYAQVV